MSLANPLWGAPRIHGELLKLGNAELIDNNAGRALAQMLPLTIEMRDHLRQEKTGNLERLAGWLRSLGHHHGGRNGIAPIFGHRERLHRDVLADETTRYL